MNKTKVTKLARKLMDEHGLHDWEFKFNNSYLALGVTSIDSQNPTDKCIKISNNLLKVGSEELIVQTMKHEIAHALVWEQFPFEIAQEHNSKHGPIWKSMAAYLSIEPKAYADAKAFKSEESKKLVIAAKLADIPTELLSHWDTCECEHCEANINTVLNAYDELPEFVKFMAEMEINND